MAFGALVVVFGDSIAGVAWGLVGDEGGTSAAVRTIVDEVGRDEGSDALEKLLPCGLVYNATSLKILIAAYLKIAIGDFVMEVVDSNLGAASVVAAVSLMHSSHCAAVQHTLHPYHSFHTHHPAHHAHHRLHDQNARGGLLRIDRAPSLCSKSVSPCVGKPSLKLFVPHSFMFTGSSRRYYRQWCHGQLSGLSRIARKSAALSLSAGGSNASEIGRTGHGGRLERVLGRKMHLGWGQHGYAQV